MKNKIVWIVAILLIITGLCFLLLREKPNNTQLNTPKWPIGFDLPIHYTIDDKDSVIVTDSFKRINDTLIYYGRLDSIIDANTPKMPLDFDLPVHYTVDGKDSAIVIDSILPPIIQLPNHED